jgi:germination protein YpeB
MFASFVLVIAGLAAFGIIADTQKENYRRQLTAYYQKSFDDMVTDIGSLQAKLGKLSASNSAAMHSLILMDIWRQTGDTESSIASIPISVSQAAPFSQFINRLGDYCRMLSKKISRGDKITAEDMKQIDALQNTCQALNKKFEEIWDNGYKPALEMNEAAYYADVSAIGDRENTQNLDFTNQEYPRLQYDGPFSESTENKKPLGLTGAEYTADEAQEAAVKFLGGDYVKEIKMSDEMNSEIAAYAFDGTSEDGAFSIYITKKGGSVLYYITNTESTVNAVPTDERYKQLTQIAIEYTKSKGYPDMEPSYAQFYSGMALINLAPVEKGIVLYPDLVKVWVDIEKNKAVGLDTKNYLMSHTQRNLAAAKITQEEAQKKLSAGLKVESTRLALIPTEQQKEVVCWEFTGKVNGSDYIVYINAETGEEEDILQIQHTNEGTLVM